MLLLAEQLGWPEALVLVAFFLGLAAVFIVLIKSRL